MESNNVAKPWVHSHVHATVNGENTKETVQTILVPIYTTLESVTYKAWRVWGGRFLTLEKYYRTIVILCLDFFFLIMLC